jgi:RNA polymerase sigma-70 factor (ECF subfamily)
MDREQPPTAPDAATASDAASPEILDGGEATKGLGMDVAQLVAAHHRELFRYAYRLTGSVADAEDLTQQTFMIAQEKGGQVREPEKIRGWLYTVLRSCFWKSRRKKTPLAAGDIELNLDQTVEEAPSDDEIDREALRAALMRLADDFREVLVMFYFEECSYKEIAAKLDLPMGTVMSRLSRAKSHLKKALTQNEQATTKTTDN